LATCPEDRLRNGAKAVELAKRVCQATAYKNAAALDVLAAACAETGRFPDAISAVTAALALPGLSPETQAQLLQRLELYRAGRPCHAK
jgi:Flp pilus assembly protein TadD